jgi:hypothetical protein
MPPLPHYAFVAWRSVKKNTGKTLPLIVLVVVVALLLVLLLLL